MAYNCKITVFKIHNTSQFIKMYIINLKFIYTRIGLKTKKTLFTVIFSIFFFINFYNNFIIHFMKLEYVCTCVLSRELVELYFN